MSDLDRAPCWRSGDPAPGEPLPTIPGWYPALHEWEAPEGYYPRAMWWDGATWRDAPRGTEVPGSILFWPAACPSAEAAEAMAKKHQPD